MLRDEPRVTESVLSHQPGTRLCSTKCSPAEGRMAPPGSNKEFHCQDNSRHIHRAKVPRKVQRFYDDYFLFRYDKTELTLLLCMLMYTSAYMQSLIN